ncbi:MAG: universal stress protein [Oceanococcus sp.]
MYHSILCLVATNEASRQLVERAQNLAKQFQAELRLLHVVEYVPLTGTEDAMLTAPIAMGEELEKQARGFVSKLAQEFSIAADRTAVVSGDLSAELNSAIQAHQIDLVVIGNHCRSGFSAFFNHAEDEVLHHCVCDLMAINLG